MKTTIALTTILLAGCAAQVVSSTPRTVIVKAGDLDVAGASKLGEAECSKYGRHARLSGRMPDTMQWVFDCVQ